MSQFLLDNFGGSGAITSHVSDSGNTWSDYPNIFFGAGSNVTHMITAGGFVGIDTASQFAAVISNVVPPTANYKIIAKVRADTAHSQQCVISGRSDGSGNGYCLVTFPIDATHVHVDLQASTLGGSLIGSTSVAVTDGGNYTVELRMNGTTISVYVDGALVSSVTDGSITGAGSVAFFLQPSGSGTLTEIGLDSIEADTLDSVFWTDFVGAVETLT